MGLKDKNLLLLCNHCILEKNRIKLFNELGFNVFSICDYMDPEYPCRYSSSFKKYISPLSFSPNRDLITEYFRDTKISYTFGEIIPKLTKGLGYKPYSDVYVNSHYILVL